jgi:hypothetical protein
VVVLALKGAKFDMVAPVKAFKKKIEHEKADVVYIRFNGRDRIGPDGKGDHQKG